MRITLLSTFVGFLVSATGCISLSSGDSTSSSSSSASSGSSSNTGGGGAGGEGTGGMGGSGGGTGGAMAGCSKPSDCLTGYFCATYTLAPLCNGQPDTSFNNDCTMDSDCPTNEICDATLCIVPHGGDQTPPLCVPGCITDTDCGPGFTCTVTNHCEAAPCTKNNDCGSGNFVCMNGQCARKDCTSDVDCANYCANGQCWANLGECKPAVP